MNIGIDMDDTITCTSETIRLYSEKYAKENMIEESDIWNIKENKNKFLETYLEEIYINTPLKENVREVFEELKGLGCKLYIITARTESYVDNIINLISEYLEKYDLEVDGIFINGKDKVDVCVNNRIDIMIDDNLYNYYMLTKNNINTLLFDDKNRYDIIDNRVNDWNKAVKIIKELFRDKAKKKIYQKIDKDIHMC